MTEETQENASNREVMFEESLSKWILAGIGLLTFVLVLAQIGVASGLLQSTPINALNDFFKATVLPITMLILGHYFGSRN